MANPTLPTQNRASGRTVSLPVASEFSAVPVVDGVPQWGAPNSTLVCTIDCSPVPVLTFDLAVEGTDDPTGLTGWGTLIKATGMPAIGTTRDGSDYVPRIEYKSTTVTSAMLRIVIESNIPATYGAAVEVF
jgi:hypothetical protein